MKQCPRCASEVGKKDKTCPRCGLPVAEMEELAKRQGVELETEVESNETKPLSKKEQKRAEKRAQKEAKKQAKKEKRERESKSDTDFSKMAKNNPESHEVFEDTYAGKRKRRKKIETTPQFELDENGEFDIDTSDVELVGEETGKLIEERYKKTYSVKKARGDYRQPKIEWWEIYKLADRAFARRKIKKEVNKAAIKKPSFISKTKLLLLAIFLGWSGAHNFYAKNKTKGWVSVVTLILWVGVAALARHYLFFKRIVVSVSGGAGFVNMFIWLGDIFNIIFNKFKYRIQKEAFIFGMNIETRAKLGEKYIDLELYKKPWWVRFKVWCEKKKKNYEEWKRDRRQRAIEKEKAKQAEAEKQAQIDAEIAEFEAKENEELKKKKEENVEPVKKVDVKDIVDKDTLKEINSFDGGLTQSPPIEKPKKEYKEKSKAKVSVKSKKTDKKK